VNVSVIIPVYNRPKLVTRAIDSVLAQTSEALYEIIVVDDGSTDDTKESLHAYRDRITLLEQENSGVSAARNRGIEAAKGEWIALLDSDDTWHPDKLKMQLAYHANNLHLKWSHTNERWIRNGKEVRQKVQHAKGSGACFADNLAFCKIAPSTVLIHRSLFERYGLFDERFPVCEDYDLWLRFLKYAPIGLVDAYLTTKYAGTHPQLTTSGYLLDRYRIEALLKHLEEDSVKVEITKKLAILERGAQKHQNADILSFCASVRKILSEL
jgi:glycosyltransferase involved in cell wall biosynthesis